MLKLKKNVKEFLKANIKPEYFLDTVEQIEGYKKFSEGAVRWLIYEHQSKSGVAFSFLLCSSDFEELEELKPYKWYPREMYDGNPKSYLIIETHEGDWTDCYANEQSELIPETTHFMYIEPLEVTDED